MASSAYLQALVPESADVQVADEKNGGVRRPALRATTPAQCRAARALLGWSQARLAREAVTCRKTISDFERSKRNVQVRTTRDIAAVFKAAGLLLTSGDGVCFAQTPREEVAPDAAFLVDGFALQS